MVIGAHSNEVILFELKDETFENPIRYNFFNSRVYSVKFFKNNLIAIGCDDKRIYIIDVAGNPLNILEGHTGIVSCIKSNALFLYTGSWDGSI